MYEYVCVCLGNIYLNFVFFFPFSEEISLFSSSVSFLYICTDDERSRRREGKREKLGSNAVNNTGLHALWYIGQTLL